MDIKIEVDFSDDVVLIADAPFFIDLTGSDDENDVNGNMKTGQNNTTKIEKYQNNGIQTIRPQSVVVFPTRNTDCINLMASPSVERFIMGDKEDTTSNSRAVRSVIQFPTNPFERTTTTLPAIEAPVTRKNTKKSLKKPPFMYTRPKHEVLSGFVNFTWRHLPANVNAILGLGDMFVPPNMPKFTEYMKELHINEENLAIEPSMYYGEYLMLSYDKILKSLYEQNSANAARLINALEDTRRIVGNQNYRFVESLNNKCTILMEAHEYNRDMDCVIQNAVQNNIYVEMRNTRYLKRWIKLCHKKYQRLQRDFLHNRQMAKAMGRPQPYSDNIQRLINEYNTGRRNVPCLYGQLKIDGEQRNLCAIANTLGWYSYPLEQIICHVLKRVLEPFLKKFYVKDITRTASDIRNTPVQDNYSFVKVEIEDIYCNVKQDDILYLLEKLVQTEIFRQTSSIDPIVFMQMMKFRFQYLQIFEYRGKTYQQVKGLLRGSTDAPVLIQLLLCYLLSQHEYEICRFPAYSRVYMHENELLFYVCDTDINSFLMNLENYLNLRFKVKTELKYYDYEENDQLVIAGRISFLDIAIHRTESKFLTKLHDPHIQDYDGDVRYSVRHLPRNWKNNVLQGHLRRILERTSNKYLLDDLYHLELNIRDFSFPHVLRFIIEHYLKIYDRIMSQGPQYENNPMCNFENMQERIWIMRKCLYDTNNKYPGHGVRNTGKRRCDTDNNDEYQSQAKRGRFEEFVK
ncbi:uncharacterized protein LOC131805896 [Musca domestica]|uniref:Uncharacterized protein LOC131805896 n=1 Tax=Musca domestica TaxID=7370 RepID=A0ABM3VIL3_MUSDO|nr:uncharacterized protein LOC131805896 [Musca domestica]